MENNFRKEYTEEVLILVFVEYSLWEQNLQSADYNTINLVISLFFFNSPQKKGAFFRTAKLNQIYQRTLLNYIK